MTKEEVNNIILDHKLRILEVKHREKMVSNQLQGLATIQNMNAQFNSLKIFRTLNTNIANKDLINLNK